jgi:hypothetical protein
MSGRDVFEKMSVRGKKDGEERISGDERGLMYSWVRTEIRSLWKIP